MNKIREGWRVVFCCRNKLTESLTFTVTSGRWWIRLAHYTVLEWMKDKSWRVGRKEIVLVRFHATRIFRCPISSVEILAWHYPNNRRQVIRFVIALKSHGKTRTLQIHLSLIGPLSIITLLFVANNTELTKFWAAHGLYKSNEMSNSLFM